LESGFLTEDRFPSIREAVAAVVKTAHFAVPAKASLDNIGVAARVVAAVIGLGKVAKLHGMTGGAWGACGTIGDGMRVEGSC
jgi:hypothetical protein